MRDWFDNLSGRDRRIVTWGGVVVLVLVLLGIIVPLDRNIAMARERVARKQDDLQFIQSVARQLASAGPAAAGANADLVVLIDSSARESGLGKSLTNSQPTGDKGLRIRLDRVAFDAMVAWLARLSQQHGVRVESAEIESAGETGLVNAGLVLKAG
jgi:general secretion pathway protein M